MWDNICFEIVLLCLQVEEQMWLPPIRRLPKAKYWNSFLEFLSRKVFFSRKLFLASTLILNVELKLFFKPFKDSMNNDFYLAKFAAERALVGFSSYILKCPKNFMVGKYWRKNALLQFVYSNTISRKALWSI